MLGTPPWPVVWGYVRQDGGGGKTNCFFLLRFQLSVCRYFQSLREFEQFECFCTFMVVKICVCILNLNVFFCTHHENDTVEIFRNKLCLWITCMYLVWRVDSSHSSRWYNIRSKWMSVVMEFWLHPWWLWKQQVCLNSTGARTLFMVVLIELDTAFQDGTPFIPMKVANWTHMPKMFFRLFGQVKHAH